MAEQDPHAVQAERSPAGVPARVPIRDLVRYYLRLGALGFGGPVALFRWNVNNLALVAAAAIIGLIAFPLLPPTWIFAK